MATVIDSYSGSGVARVFRFAAAIMPVLLVALVLWAGWEARDERYLDPEAGLGYALGIAGGTLMLLLLGYPLRKRLRWMAGLGSVRHWFRMHMIFGVLGPVLILYHCNFQPGSLNSNVALFSMLTVALSGLAGRFIYGRIHLGLYGRRASLADLSVDSLESGRRLGAALEFAPQVRALLKRYEELALSRQTGLVGSIARSARLAFQTRHVRRRANRELALAARGEDWSDAQRQRRLARLRAKISHHLGLVRKVARFSMYERLFALWHVLHLPLFVMLVVTATVHVWAVHAY